MKHLTLDEIVAVADQTIANGSLSTALHHLEECPRCRREVDFQKRILDSARHATRVSVSKEFAGRLEARLNLPPERRHLLRYLGNLGNVFGFAMVVGLFGIIYDLVSNFQAKPQTERLSFWSDFSVRWELFVDWIRSQNLAIPQSALPAIPTDSTSFYASVIVAVVGLIVIDRLLGGHFLHHHAARNK